MRSLLFLLLSSFITISCASKKHQVSEYENIPHEHKSTQEQKVAYDGNCAMSVSEDHCDIKAKQNISYEYKGTTYFFSSEGARSKFIKDIDKNIEKANAAWERNQRRLDRH
jgi:YHS domain-containing protein